MEVDAKQFLKDGYLILRQAVAPERLDHMRLLVELMVDKSKAMSVAERTKFRLWSMRVPPNSWIFVWKRTPWG